MLVLSVSGEDAAVVADAHDGDAHPVLPVGARVGGGGAHERGGVHGGNLINCLVAPLHKYEIRDVGNLKLKEK